MGNLCANVHEDPSTEAKTGQKIKLNFHCDKLSKMGKDELHDTAAILYSQGSM